MSNMTWAITSIAALVIGSAATLLLWLVARPLEWAWLANPIPWILIWVLVCALLFDGLVRFLRPEARDSGRHSG